ncbi:MAG: beta-N-acetylhexosaminidase, partial [Bacteroidales bacterium]|nr:beta-N-acetylhexosaminidase [Bacteroidales bacterium]
MLCGCAKDIPELHVVPAPQSVEMKGGFLDVRGINFNCDPAMDSASAGAVRGFAEELSLLCGRTCTVGEGKGVAFVVDASMAPEAYSVRIGRKDAEVRASGFGGFFYALQTIRQMLPVASGAQCKLPCCEISDAPRFGYRGLMLDCCRHFFSVEEVKKVLDVMSVYKLNRFHWHLSEDQGWRIQIDKYPRLTEVGAWRNGTMVGGDWKSNDGIRYGGFYTKDQIRDVIEYAAARGITIVPEIDLPGHMQAALASYPELGCKGSKPQPYEVWTVWGVSKQVLNVGNEKTMRFLEDVLGEVADLFPGEYIHIGGDECPRDEWKTDPQCQAKIRELGLKDSDGVSAEARLQNYV